MPIDSSRSIPLADFIKIQHQGEEAALVAGDDGQPRVIAIGRTAGGREVSWIQPYHDGAEAQIAQRFLGALADQYGSRITKAVADELKTELSTARLQTSTIGQAVRMAESQLDTFGGVNFFLELHCSAAALTPAFRLACQRTGWRPEQFSKAQLADIDVRFRQALNQASHANQTPLAADEGEALLVQVLRALPQPAGNGEPA